MPLVLYPKLKNETSLPLYVKGVGVGSSELAGGSEVMLVSVKGTGRVRANGKDYQIPDGQGLYLGKGVKWECRAAKGTDQWIFDWVSFCFTNDELKDALFTEDDIVPLRFNRPAMVSEDIRKILEAVSRDTEYGGFFASAMLYSMLIELNRETLNIPDAKDKVNGAVSAVIEYINEHYAESITLDELCKVAGGLSEQYFCRLFKQHTGTRPIEYILRKRIGVARTYLEKTDMSITDVAKKTGFNNTSYFYRNFKKFMGISPLTCRQISHI